MGGLRSVEGFGEQAGGNGGNANASQPCTTGAPRPVVKNIARQVSWLTTRAVRSPFTFPPTGSGVTKGVWSFTVAGAAAALPRSLLASAHNRRTSNAAQATQ